MHKGTPMKRICPILALIALSSISLTLIFCGKHEAGWGGTILNDNGLIVVRNPSHPLVKQDILSLNEELVLGGNAPGIEFGFVLSIDVDQEENIYVLELNSPGIRVFDRTGRFLRTIGSRGQGPGELQRPHFLQIDENDRELMVWDPVVYRFQIYSYDGKFLRTSSAAGLGLPIEPVGSDPNGNLIAYVIPPPIEGGVELVKLNNQLELVTVISKAEKNNLSLSKSHSVMSPGLFSAVANDGQVIWGYSKKYELYVLDSLGKLTKRISRACRARKIDAESKKQLEERYSRTSVAKVGYKPIFPKRFPFFQDISVDEEGRIFVLTYEKASREDGACYHDIFDPVGRYLAKVIFPKGTRSLLWKRGKLFTIERDDEGYSFVKRYGVLWDKFEFSVN